MAETEVSNKVPTVVGVEEKCRSEMSSCEDLPKPDCNGTGDLDNSYVFVTGDDGLPDDTVGDKDADVGGSSVSPESKAVVAEDQVVKLDPENEKLDPENEELDPEIEKLDHGNVELSNGELTLVNDSTSKHESSLDDGERGEVSFDDSVEGNAGETEILVEAEVKLLKDPDGNMAEAVVDKVVDQNGEIKGVAADEQEKLDDLMESDSSSGLVENQESQFRDLGLVTESEEIGDSENTSSLVDSSVSEKDGFQDQINLSTIGTLKAYQGSEGVVVNVAGSDLQDVITEAKDEVKLEREVVKTAEDEVPTSTSLDLDLESCPTDDKEETIMEESGEKDELNIISSNTNDAGNANNERDEEINLSVTEAAEASQGSEDVVVNVADSEVQDVSMEAKDEVILDVVVNVADADCDLQDVNMETKDEIKLDREVVETAEHGVLESTSSDLELESPPINNKEENVEEEATTTLSSAVVQSQHCNSELDNNIPGVLEPMDEAKTVLINTDCPVEPVGDLVLDEKSEEHIYVSHVDNGVQYPEVPDKHLDGIGVSSETSLSDTKTEASVPTQSIPALNSCQPQIENEISDAETIGAVSSLSVDGPKSQVVEEALPVEDSSTMSNINEATSGSDSTLDTIVLTEKEPTSRGGETHAETEVLSEKPKAADSPPETLDVKMEPVDHIHDVSTASSGETASSVTLACGTEVSDNFDVKKDAANIVLEIRDVEDMVDQLDGAAGISNENLSLQENEDTKNSSSNNISVEKRDVEDMVDQLDGAAGISDENLSLQKKEDTEHSSSNNVSVASLGGSLINGEAPIVKNNATPFNFLVRVPRLDDESLREQIRLAKLHVDEKTKLREAIQFQIQDKRANSQVHGIDYEYAKGEARSARKLVRSKRVEIDSLQSVINKAKNALSIEDIDSQIYNMEHMIQHETLPLKEEKQLIREIKQLKQLREQLSSNMGSHDEVKQALEQREEVEERLKILRKELDVLKGRVLKAEAVAVEAEKKYDDENKKVRELQTQFRAADDVRQAAYAQWQNLRKELSEKTKHFFKYKDNAALANNYAFTRNTEALYRLCFHNVENFMELWNTSEEFRTDYVKFNARSYVRRFGTSDGRSLGPDEEPLALPSYVGDRVKVVPTPVKVDDLTSQIATRELKQEPTVENVILEDKTVKKATEHKNPKVTEHKNPKMTNKEPTIHIHSNGLDSDSARDITDEVQEEPKKSKDEIEAIRKAEEMRKEEIEAKLKEERRLEALAKANEARERKKRQAEKLLMRAELKTQKEAEQKEKEREKRLRKKERKKAATDVSEIETAPSSETASVISNETEVKDTSSSSSSVAPKKPQKSWLFGKQSKGKSVVPPALRNRNKKRMHQWIWVGVTSLVILLLFWLGNMGVFSSVHMKRRNPVH